MDKDFNKEYLVKKLEESDYNRIEFTQHFYSRARRRNVNYKDLKNKIREHDFEKVQKNNQSDPNFDYSFKVSIKLDRIHEVPIYFNVPGNKVLVKSVW